MAEAKIEVSRSHLFTTGSVLVIWAYGILLIIPIVISFMVITVMQFGLWTILIPLLTLVVTSWFVPLGQGNPYIVSRFRQRSRQTHTGTNLDFLVQLSLSPRIRTGVRATLEDADDFGFLSLGENGFTFDGDAVQLSVPYQNIQKVCHENVGLRGRFVYGPRITLDVRGLPNVRFLQFAERSSALLPQSKRITRQLLEQFERATSLKNSPPAVSHLG